MATPPLTLRLATGVQAVEAAGMLLATGFAAASTGGGHSYTVKSGIALTVLAFLTTAALALVAYGLATAKPWSRTPAVMTQVFTAGAAVYLLDGHRLDWGVPAMVLAVAGIAGLLAPPSLRALNRPDPAPQQPAPKQPTPKRPASKQPGRATPKRPSKTTGPGKTTGTAAAKRPSRR